jgi:HAD superfamily hydrolase (TIGR01509 family)
MVAAVAAMSDAWVDPVPWKIRAVLFDMDGTLIANTYPFETVRAKVLGLLGETGIFVPKRTYRSIADLLEYVKLEHRASYNNVKERIYSVLTEYDELANRNSQLRSGAVDVLLGVKAKQCKVGVISNSSLKVVVDTLQRLGVIQFFDVALARESVERIKPFPDLVLAACQKLSEKPFHTLVVGDSWVDIEAGNAANAKTVYLNIRESGFKVEPWVEITELKQLLKYL